MDRNAQNSLNESIKDIFLGEDSPPQGEPDLIRQVQDEDSNKEELLNKFIAEVFVGIDLTEHTQDSMMGILAKAIENVFMLREALEDLPAVGSNSSGDFKISKEDSEELKKLAIAHHETGKIGEHDPESLEGQEQIERGKALTNKMREVAGGDPNDANSHHVSLVRKEVDNHIQDHVTVKNWDGDEDMRDAEREAGFSVGGMSASKAERKGW